MNLRRCRPRYVDAIGAAVLIALGAVAYCAGFRPVVLRQAKLLAQRGTLEAWRRDVEGLARTTAALQDRSAVLRRVLEENPIRLEPIHQANRRIARIANLAGGEGLKINEIKPGGPAEKERFFTVPIHLEVSGSYPACVRLVRRLRVDFPDTAVVRLELVGAPARPTEPARMRLDLLWHAAKPELPPR